MAASPHVERLIHFSDMGADERHASQRMATKGKGDRLVQELVPNATIVRYADLHSRRHAASLCFYCV